MVADFNKCADCIASRTDSKCGWEGVTCNYKAWCRKGRRFVSAAGFHSVLSRRFYITGEVSECISENQCTGYTAVIKLDEYVALHRIQPLETSGCLYRCLPPTCPTCIAASMKLKSKPLVWCDKSKSSSYALSVRIWLLRSYFASTLTVILYTLPLLAESGFGSVCKAKGESAQTACGFRFIARTEAVEYASGDRCH